jgi:hypothetical protein
VLILIPESTDWEGRAETVFYFYIPYWGEKWHSWLRHCTTRLESRWGPWKFSSDLMLLSTLSLKYERVPRYFLGGKLRPAHRTDNSATTVVPNVKVRMEAYHSIPLLSLQKLLQETFLLAKYHILRTIRALRFQKTNSRLKLTFTNTYPTKWQDSTQFPLIILMHLWTIRCRKTSCSISQNKKKCILWSTKYSIFYMSLRSPPHDSRMLCVSMITIIDALKNWPTNMSHKTYRLKQKA